MKLFSHFLGKKKSARRPESIASLSMPENVVSIFDSRSAEQTALDNIRELLDEDWVDDLEEAKTICLLHLSDLAGLDPNPSRTRKWKGRIYKAKTLADMKTIRVPLMIALYHARRRFF